MRNKSAGINQTKSNTEIGIFKKICQRELGDNLRSLILFGSQAKGTGGKQSDYDFLILTKKEGDFSRIKNKLLLSSFQEMSRPLHLVIKSERDFFLSLENLSPFALEIMDSGKTMSGNESIKEKLPFFQYLLQSKRIKKIVLKGMEAWKIAS